MAGNNQKSLFRKIVKFFANVKLAVVIILSLAIITAIGTFVEAKYDAQAAAKLVYHTYWMFGILAILAFTLIAVMIDRWPWKQRHIPFLLAHVGILVLLLGSIVTMKYGIDGTMRFGIGEKNRFVTIPTTDLQIWSSFDGDRYSQVLNQEVDFFRHHPKKNPFKISLMEGEFQVLDYEPYVFPTKKVVESDSPRVGAAIRFVVQNAQVNVNDWLLQSKENVPNVFNFGPAQLTLGPAPSHPTGKNEIFISTTTDPKAVQYTVFYKDGKASKKGLIKEGDSFETGWMGLKFKLLRYLPKAREDYDFKVSERPTPLTTAAIELSILGKKHWLQMNDVLKIFTEQSMYLITYGNRRLDLGFDIHLDKFEIGRYQGTMRAAEYSSMVTAPNGEQILISMNEPLKYEGFTFYQASFQEDPQGQPIASILSVNKDPGRWIKYLGSLIISLGIAWLFYQRRKATRAQAPAKGQQL